MENAQLSISNWVDWEMIRRLSLCGANPGEHHFQDIQISSHHKVVIIMSLRGLMMPSKKPTQLCSLPCYASIQSAPEKALTTGFLDPGPDPCKTAGNALWRGQCTVFTRWLATKGSSTDRQRLDALGREQSDRIASSTWCISRRDFRPLLIQYASDMHGRLITISVHRWHSKPSIRGSPGLCPNWVKSCIETRVILDYIDPHRIRNGAKRDGELRSNSIPTGNASIPYTKQILPQLNTSDTNDLNFCPLHFCAR
jgi:hypothetical protein